MRYLLGFLIAIGLIVLVFILILKGFSSGNSTTQSQTPLVSYATGNATAEMIIDGPITAQQTHQEVQINVNQFSDQVNIIQGYQNTVINSKTYSNNQTAYAVFLRALQVANFNKGNSKASSDERGYCPSGDRYIFELNNGSKQIERYWATSCGNQGTFGGNLNAVRSLFMSQIPDYNSLTETLNII